jgi:anti-sigma regulatory factor (Ser/Thr protein kinase)
VTEWSHTKTWTADPVAIAGARRFVRACLDSTDDDDLIGDVSLVVSELATNAVIHAGTTFSVTLASSPGGSLLLTVRDASPSEPSNGGSDPFALGGRGLLLVEAHCVAWGFSPEVQGGKSVWASFDGGAQARMFRTEGEGVGEPAR